MRDLVGEIVGNYRLVKLLGKGGYARVYLGEHVVLQINAAVKILDTNFGEDANRFKKEAQIIAQLRHKRIVQLLISRKGTKPSSHIDESSF